MKRGSLVKYIPDGTTHTVLAASDKLIEIEKFMFGEMRPVSVKVCDVELVESDKEIVIPKAKKVSKAKKKTKINSRMSGGQLVESLISHNFVVRDNSKEVFSYRAMMGNYYEFIKINSPVVFDMNDFKGISIFQFERIFYFDKKIIGSSLSYILKFERSIWNILKSKSYIKFSKKKDLGELELIYSKLDDSKKKVISQLWGIDDTRMFGYTLWLFRLFRNKLAHNVYVKLITPKVAAKGIGSILYKEGKQAFDELSIDAHNKKLALSSIIYLRQYINDVADLKGVYKTPYCEKETSRKLDQNKSLFIDFLYLMKILDKTNIIWDELRESLTSMIGHVNNTDMIDQVKGASLVGIDKDHYRTFTSFNSKFKR